MSKQSLAEWYYNPLKGQPRYVDIGKLRQMASAETVSLKVKALIDATLSAPIRIEGRAAKEFFSHFDFKPQLQAFLDDLLVLDAGVFVKSFSQESYKTVGPTGATLKPLGKRKLIEIWARDGGSFLKEIDVNGIVHRYWQYSYLHDKVAPIEFDVAEIVYCERHPRSYSCYGWSELESIGLSRSRIWGPILRRLGLKPKPKLYELTPQTVTQLRRLVEQAMNSQVMPEFGKGARFRFGKNET